MSPEKAFLQFRDATEQYSMLKQVIHWQRKRWQVHRSLGEAGLHLI